MKHLSLNVQGMHCPSCEMLIKDELEETEGVQNVKVSWKEGFVLLDYEDDKIDENKIMSIIKKEGYDVK